MSSIQEPRLSPIADEFSSLCPARENQNYPPNSDSGSASVCELAERDSLNASANASADESEEGSEAEADEAGQRVLDDRSANQTATQVPGEHGQLGELVELVDASDAGVHETVVAEDRLTIDQNSLAHEDADESLLLAAQSLIDSLQSSCTPSENAAQLSQATLPAPPGISFLLLPFFPHRFLFRIFIMFLTAFHSLSRKSILFYFL